ncbi:error-prone DNA polymerase (plasmid) [Lichenicola cladoniae]|uniref:Error-prone DNA polymerase n=1 Tax=Lichenicola cladoniae TaxID=1484109 RepID=A0A6M8HXU6_9PROT|nr:error-prone DNA polymerase [Lichenicola cladoniae]NPD70135.1 error-prone DNA polymerase [Acetobacteraceae bacterium]QKE93017.1 error-prone DNA polymerase [Lichenicola cladoniae]
MSDYVELQVTSNYSFLRGASHVEELFLAAKDLELPAIAVTDHNTLAGIARAHARAEEVGIRLIVGCRLDLRDGLPVLAYPTDRAAYARLCRLLTLGKGRTGKGGCDIGWADLLAHGEGLLLILLPDAVDARLELELASLRQGFAGRCYLQLSLRRRPGDAVRLRQLSDLAQAARVPTVVTGDVLFHAPDRRILQDVVTCIRESCTIDDAGFRRERFADRHLKAPAEMHRLFGAYPEALMRTLEIADRCRFSLSELRYQYPDEADIAGQTPQQALEQQVGDSIPLRYPDGLPADVAKQLQHELDLIAALDYASYFLTVNSIVRFARSKEILCQGRGSAANSAVCYVLGITSIDPVRSGLLFERFISAERREPPDIDVDFESERREEVIQWVYQRYGRDRAALCCTVMRFHSRGAIRDVGKAMGLPADVTAALAGQVSAWSNDGISEAHAAELNLNLTDRRLRLTLQLARELIGFPRQLGTHPGGFVLTQDRLDDLVPIEPASMADRQVIEWDKDDIDALKFMKVDVLGLGMLGCMRRSFELLQEHHGVTMDVATIPAEDPATYAMIRKADTLGTFQIESRAQMSMLPRLKPVTFYDLVVQVAIVRPGPIQGDMVHPYLRRREGKEPVEYPKEELRRVLGKTLGIPLFQEQAMQVAIQCAGFTPGEADQLRRSMATFKFTGGVSHFKDKLIEGMVGKGYERSYAERTFSQLEGFGSYGFPESHAASFALIAYASSWMKCHHPDVFCVALLNSQPMGFYAPAQVVRDARQHGVEVRPVCVNASRWDCTLEPRRDNGPGLAVRLGLRLAKGLANQDGAQLVAHRGEAPYRSVEEIWRRADIPAAALERLAEADAFQGLGLDRRQALWQVKGLADTALPLFAAADMGRRPRPELVEPLVALTPMKDGREVVEDYRSIGLSLRRHPVSFIRPQLQARRMISCADLRNTRDGLRIIVPGIVLVRQKPGSAKGVMFITIEDETGVANLILWPDRFEAQRRLVLSAGMIACHGKVQREGEVIHVVTDRLDDLSDLLWSVGDQDGAFPIRHGQGDVVTHPATRDPRDGPGAGPGGRPIRHIDIPDLHIRSGIKVPTRDFR